MGRTNQKVILISEIICMAQQNGIYVHGNAIQVGRERSHIGMRLKSCNIDKCDMCMCP